MLYALLFVFVFVVSLKPIERKRDPVRRNDFHFLCSDPAETNGNEYQNNDETTERSALNHERNRPDSLTFTHEVKRLVFSFL